MQILFRQEQARTSASPRRIHPGNLEQFHTVLQRFRSETQSCANDGSCLDAQPINTLRSPLSNPLSVSALAGIYNNCPMGERMPTEYLGMYGVHSSVTILMILETGRLKIAAGYDAPQSLRDRSTSRLLDPFPGAEPRFQNPGRFEIHGCTKYTASADPYSMGYIPPNLAAVDNPKTLLLCNLVPSCGLSRMPLECRPRCRKSQHSRIRKVQILDLFVSTVGYSAAD